MTERMTAQEIRELAIATRDQASMPTSLDACIEQNLWCEAREPDGVHDWQAAACAQALRALSYSIGVFDPRYVAAAK